LLPRLMAKEVIKKSEIIDLSYGGDFLKKKGGCL